MDKTRCKQTLNWYDPSRIFILPMEEKVLDSTGGEFKGLSSSSFLAINAKGGESIKPKAKEPHHHFKIFNKKLKEEIISFGISFGFKISIDIISFGICFKNGNHFKNSLDS
jgi:hypothetical protein